MPLMTPAAVVAWRVHPALGLGVSIAAAAGVWVLLRQIRRDGSVTYQRSARWPARSP